VSMTIRGGENLRGDLSRLSRALGENGAETGRMLEAAAQPVLEQMIHNAGTDPRPRSGRLKSAIRIRRAARGARVTVGVHRTEGGAAYAVPVEFGHGGPAPAPPHPFVRPAFDARADDAYALLKQQLNDALGLRGL